MVKKQTARSSTVISARTGQPVDRKRSIAARRAAKTRKANSLVAATRQLRLHHKVIAGGAIAAVLVLTFLGIHTQLETYAASTAQGTFIGLGSRCLDNDHSNAVNANHIQLWHCNGTAAQKWTVSSDGSVQSGNNTRYCLDVPGSSKAEYTYLQLWQCNGSDAQKFKVSGNTLVSTLTGFCATVHYAETTNGTRIWMKHCHGSDAQKWTYHGTTVTSPTIPVTTPTPPTTGGGSGTSGGGSTGGTGSTEASYNLGTTISGLSAGSTLVLKNGTYSVSNFGYFNTMGVYSKNIANVVGNGVGNSVIQMTAKTSTKAGSVPTASGTTNQLYLMRVDGSPSLSGFTLQGTNQGHLYNGLSLYHTTNAKLSNLKVAAIPGNYNAPPGETFSINDFHGSNTTYTNVEIDGAGVGASAFGLNSTSGGTWNNCYAHDNKYSIGWAFWQHTNGATINNSRSTNNRGGVNFERATGTYRINNMTFGGNTSSDISGGQDQSGDFKVIITDPILTGGQTKLKVNWFKTEAGTPDKYGKKNIQVIVKGVDRTSDMIQWIGVGAG